MTTISLADFRPSPDIILGQAQHRRLQQLALGGTGHTPDDADDLLYELKRAIVVPEFFMPPDVARVGSIVTYREALGEFRTVQLVWPNEADPAAGRISILDQVGIALLGLRPGLNITIGMRDPERRLLMVIDVVQPDGSDDDPEPPAAA